MNGMDYSVSDIIDSMKNLNINTDSEEKIDDINKNIDNNHILSQNDDTTLPNLKKSFDNEFIYKLKNDICHLQLELNEKTCKVEILQNRLNTLEINQKMQQLSDDSYKNKNQRVTSFPLKAPRFSFDDFILGNDNNNNFGSGIKNNADFESISIFSTTSSNNEKSNNTSSKTDVTSKSNMSYFAYKQANNFMYNFIFPYIQSNIIILQNSSIFKDECKILLEKLNSIICPDEHNDGHESLISTSSNTNYKFTDLVDVLEDLTIMQRRNVTILNHQMNINSQIKAIDETVMEYLKGCNDEFSRKFCLDLKDKLILNITTNLKNTTETIEKRIHKTIRKINKKSKKNNNFDHNMCEPGEKETENGIGVLSKIVNKHKTATYTPKRSVSMKNNKKNLEFTPIGHYKESLLEETSCNIQSCETYKNRKGSNENAEILTPTRTEKAILLYEDENINSKKTIAQKHNRKSVYEEEEEDDDDDDDDDDDGEADNRQLCSFFEELSKDYPFSTTATH
ncbi:uncharacterized protein SCDLUD_001571 [Saccharomycodes ludwigii]|uniref:uncharacterized protein n=1 Tax=Saccharomycodes ludwigii TaxID=36035 RepID=UPI001E863E66|nr:hypothetical protein SCDLUD_001571 [Saccharomycodes ludwigii]KAH3901792.1 hypothetical protein SCDLUD_001571 [Saccharomycodes ludwigii]